MTKVTYVKLVTASDRSYRAIVLTYCKFVLTCCSGKQVSIMSVKLASATTTNTASDSESLKKLIFGQLGDGEQEYDLYLALALTPYPLIGP